MRADELRVGRLYAFPTNPGPWYRHAVPARVMAHALRERVLVLFPDGVPAGPNRPELPRAALVWMDADALVAPWSEWPEIAAASRADLTAVVASAVAAIGGSGAPTLETPRRPEEQSPWWARPIGMLLRPPAVRPDHH